MERKKLLSIVSDIYLLLGIIVLCITPGNWLRVSYLDNMIDRYLWVFFGILAIALSIIFAIVSKVEQRNKIKSELSK